MGCGGSNNAGAEQRQMENERLARVEAGKAKIDEAFKGFDDDFYSKRSKDYEAYAVPQLTSDYDNTKRNLKYSLARSGLMGSSSDVSKRSSLDKELAKQYRGVVDAGQSQANELRRDIEGQRSNLVSQLQASSDPGNAGALAMRTAQAYSTPTSFAPVSNFFANWTSNFLANQEARQYNPNVAPLFGWGAQTQRIV